MANVIGTVATPKIALPKPGEQAPSGIPFNIDWTVYSNGVYDINLQYAQSQGQIGGVQAIFWNNPSAGAIQITFGGSGQSLTLPAKTQGYMPVLMPNVPTAHLVNTAPDSTITQVILLNYVLPGISISIA